MAQKTCVVGVARGIYDRNRRFMYYACQDHTWQQHDPLKDSWSKEVIMVCKDRPVKEAHARLVRHGCHLCGAKLLFSVPKAKNFDYLCHHFSRAPWEPIWSYIPLYQRTRRHYDSDDSGYVELH